jgi:hypothetical protein
LFSCVVRVSFFVFTPVFVSHVVRKVNTTPPIKKKKKPVQRAQRRNT